MELHEENAFKARALQNAAFQIDRLQVPLTSLSQTEISEIEGLGKGAQAKITQLLENGTFPELEQLLVKTPPGIIEILSVKGIGPKKVATLWKDLGIESAGELLYACNENRLVELKGFGSKTQQQIKNSLEYREASGGKYLYATAEQAALQVVNDLISSGKAIHCSLTGQMRRRIPVIEVIEIIAATEKGPDIFEFLLTCKLIDENSLVKKEISGIPVFEAAMGGIRTIIFISSVADFETNLFLTTGSEVHIEKVKSLLKKLPSTEKNIYASAGLPFFEPELRENDSQFNLIKNSSLPELVKVHDLRGILHNHSTYSDGADTLEVMAAFCKEAGFEYLGISDHSKSAFYANGLQEERIQKQHSEIDKLNKKLHPFRIFKGIESDVLSDGSLDYSDEILSSFDFVVASIHSNLRMDEVKATARLLRAIENKYTTILGHPTGRLLLSRPGYPIDHKKIIDACAVNGVVIELNSNPHRLDMDWQWIPYALEKNVMISINPDAHRKEGFFDMHYGVCVARKGGLPADMTFNSKNAEEMEKYFLAKKTKTAI
jgi:DNA polymerase (family X)